MRITSGKQALAEEKFAKDLDTLTRYYLVEYGEQQLGMLQIHPLVKTCTQFWLEKTGHRARWKKHFLRSMACEFPERPSDHWDECEQLSLHLQHLSGSDDEVSDKASVKIWIELCQGSTVLYRAIDLGEDVLGVAEESTMASRVELI
ncbi:hypothetical protein B0T26DRAFT_750903 [Lasiosphaeria miniovina]|uniref:Uncharacterized protein n=1 Tax=Lasiosphaeria miniovina TaxID=1954250 RepID=A0AA40AJ25_9PEZI|nr:uncharacterized protein B0T26DRAFT_750903 [Lasiosphaeria miniovina]KAK0716759.1 hypothetical protein B0T26DRAFT_750903 [Lasiosphaeria miniovina]